MPMPIILPSATLLWIEFDECVDPHDGNARFHGTLELLHFAHTRFQHAGLDAVVHTAFRQIEAVVAIALRLSQGLGVWITVARNGALLGWFGCAVGLVL